MDVQCERCKTVYDFDDALVSGRGTTVKCTQCGHQFKVRRPSDASALAPEDEDRWTVTTRDGRTRVFRSLRELQKAILAQEVTRSDALTRGNGTPRAIGSITELEPFFDGTGAALLRPSNAPRVETPRPRPAVAQGAQGVKSTLIGPAPPPPPSIPVPAVAPSRRPTLRGFAELGGGENRPFPPSPTAQMRADDLALGTAATVAVSPAAGTVAPVPEVRRRTPVPPAPAFAPAFAGGAPQSVPAPVASVPAPVNAVNAVNMGAASLPPPTVPVRRSSYDDLDPPRLAASSLVDAEAEASGRAPRRVGGWVIAAVLLLGAGAVGAVAMKPYLERIGKPAASGAAAIDPRAAQYLADGEKALGDGDIQRAKEAFDKASALAEHDPRVLLDAARLEAVRADVPWLKLRLLPADAADDARATKASLDELSAKARQASEAALAAAPDDVAAVRARVDALRISGERDAARALVTKIINDATQPETAYVLAALDLAEAEPLWPMVIERLRLAASAEGGVGRARAALAYALARSGDLGAAKAEVERLATAPRPSALVPALRAFVQHAPTKVDGGVAALTTTTATVDVGALPRSPAPSHGGAHGASGGGGGGGGGGGDPRALLGQASEALKAGQPDRAKALYSAALAQNARDSEALAGLGDVAHAAHDPTTAIGYYRRALAVNPVYLPALIGVADCQWEQGNRAEAQRAYKDVTDRFPEGTYPARVKQRAEAAAPASGGTASPGSAASGGSEPDPSGDPGPTP